MAKVSLVNREMSHTHIYIYVTQITKWGLKIQLNYSKYIIFFFKLDLVITLKHLCHSKGTLLAQTRKNIYALQCRRLPKPCFLNNFAGFPQFFCSMDNVAALGNRKLPPYGVLAVFLYNKIWSRHRVGLFSCLHKWDFLPYCQRRQLFTIFASGARMEG